MKCLMDHIVLNVSDMEAMLDFYLRVLELPPERLEVYSEGQPCGTHLKPFCLALEKAEWARLTERLKKGDVAIVDGPVERWGAYGTGISIYIRDPENNLIEARYYRGEVDVFALLYTKLVASCKHWRLLQEKHCY